MRNASRRAASYLPNRACAENRTPITAEFWTALPFQAGARMRALSACVSQREARGSLPERDDAVLYALPLNAPRRRAAATGLSELLRPGYAPVCLYRRIR